MEISEGFMYLQLLRRLTTEKFFTTYLRGSPEGLLRKYYQITNVGKENLKALRAEWQHFIEGVNELILEEGIG